MSASDSPSRGHASTEKGRAVSFNRCGQIAASTSSRLAAVAPAEVLRVPGEARAATPYPPNLELREVRPQ